MKVLITSILFGKNMTGLYLKYFVSGTQLANTGLTVLQFDSELDSPGWRLLTWNDKAHLGEFQDNLK